MVLHAKSQKWQFQFSTILRFWRVFHCLPLSEFLEGNSVGKTLSADTNTLQHTITPELVQDKAWFNHASLLVFIGNDAANKMRAGTVQGVHQSSQLFLNEDMDTVSLQESYMYFHYEGPLGYMFPTQPFFVLSYNAALRDETKWLQGRLMLR